MELQAICTSPLVKDITNEEIPSFVISAIHAKSGRNPLKSRVSSACFPVRKKSTHKAEKNWERTVIDNLKEAVVVAKQIKEQDVVFLMDRFGYAKTVDVSVYERNKETADAENRCIFKCKNTDKICIFTDKGQLHLLKVLDLPYGKFRDKGTPIDNVCNYDSKEENFVYITSLAHVSCSKVLFGTKQSMLKVVDGAEFVVAKKTTAATKLMDEVRVPYKSTSRLRSPIKYKDSKGNEKIWKPSADGAMRGDVWDFPTLAGKAFRGEKTSHPSQKPESLITELIKAFCPMKNGKYNGTILDPFHGSGTLGVCCEKLNLLGHNIRWTGIELERKWCQIAIERLNSISDGFK